MAILRKKHDRNFTTISNDALKDKDLSFKAKGLLVYMWSLPDDWEFYETELAKRSKDGLASVKSGLKELEQAGYLIKQRVRRPNGQLGENDWVISDKPIQSIDNSELVPEVEKPTLDNPALEKPTLENHTLLNTNTTKDLLTLNTNNTSAEEKKKQIPHKEIIEYLNKKTGKRISYKTEGNRELISGRWNEGYTLEDFKKVIDNKANDWLGTGVVFSNGKLAEDYLHPTTLFRSSNFDKYLNQSTVANGGKSYGGLEF